MFDQGSIISLDEDASILEVKSFGVSASQVASLIGRRFVVGTMPDQAKITEDDNVIIPGVGEFPGNVFMEVEIDFDKDCYQLTIETTNKTVTHQRYTGHDVTSDLDPRYVHYSNVVDHKISEIGLTVQTVSGRTVFYAWGFDGGIESIAVNSGGIS